MNNHKIAACAFFQRNYHCAAPTPHFAKSCIKSVANLRVDLSLTSFISRVLSPAALYILVHLPTGAAGRQPDDNVLHLEVAGHSGRTPLGVVRGHAVFGRLSASEVKF